MRSAQAYLSKPLSLLMIIIVLTFFLLFVSDFTARSKQLRGEVDISMGATKTLTLLVNSKSCLAYRPEIGGAYGYMVSSERLQEFSEKYAGLEPECARNYQHGYRVTVRDLTEDRTWEFGAKSFSKGRSLVDKVKKRLPIAIRYGPERVDLGEITITYVLGDLESLTGDLDLLCEDLSVGNRRSFSFYTGATLQVEGGEVCLKYSSTRQSCKPTVCEIRMDAIENPGSYEYVAEKVADGVLEVSP